MTTTAALNDARNQLRFAELQEPFLQFRTDEMVNHRFTILVYHYLLGQYRIKLTDRSVPDIGCPEGHGSIVAELCTYKHEKLAHALTHLRLSHDPQELAHSWRTAWNAPNGYVDLDRSEPQS